MLEHRRRTVINSSEAGSICSRNIPVTRKYCLMSDLRLLVKAEPLWQQRPRPNTCNVGKGQKRAACYHRSWKWTQIISSVMTEETKLDTSPGRSESVLSSYAKYASAHKKASGKLTLPAFHIWATIMRYSLAGRVLPISPGTY